MAVSFQAAIRELVDVNFDNIQKYPKLAYSGINETDILNLSTGYLTLTQAGAVIPSDSDEKYFRELLDLPERDPDDLSRKPVDPNAVDPNQPEKGKTKQPGTKGEEADMSELLGWLKKKPEEWAFSEGFKPYRPLTLAEEKVDFDALQTQMDKMEAEFVGRTRELLHNARTAFMAALTKAAHAGDTQAIKSATLKVLADYARIIKQAVTAAYTYGKTNAAKEMGVQAPANPADMLRQIDIQAATIAEQQIAEIVGTSKNAYVQALNKGESVTASLADADKAAEETIDTLTQDTGEILMAGYINHGRNTVFTKFGDNIYALQRSEVLDTRTCNFCLSMDGRIIPPDDNFGDNTIFHSNCRGIWVAIMNDEAELPPIGGIPKAIRDRFGDAVNDLIQPKTPIVRQGTPAAKEAQRRSGIERKTK